MFWKPHEKQHENFSPLFPMVFKYFLLESLIFSVMIWLSLSRSRRMGMSMDSVVPPRFARPLSSFTPLNLLNNEQAQYFLGFGGELRV